MIAKLMLTATLVGMVLGHSHYQTMIPNGDSVPHPCNSGTWQGVGHQNSAGMGLRNAFGLDFGSHSHSWSAVCRLDSDGDGVTNGAELGDPNCVWVAGHGVGHPPPPPQGRATGHPGICEPIGSARCAGAWSPC